MSPDAPAKKPVEAVMAYLRGQGLTRVQQLAEIKQGDALVQVTGNGNQYCDFYVAIARRFQPEEGLEGGESPLWDLAGRYAWANVPTVTTEVPPYEVNDSSRHDLTQEDLAQKAGFIITEQESPLGKIAAEIR